MFRTETITTKTKDGTEVEIRGEIIWPNPQGRPQGSYIKIYFNDEGGNRVEARPCFYGALRGKNGLVIDGLINHQVLEIPKADYEDFVRRCLGIFWDGMEKNFGRPRPKWLS